MRSGYSQCRVLARASVSAASETFCVMLDSELRPVHALRIRAPHDRGGGVSRSTSMMPSSSSILDEARLYPSGPPQPPPRGLAVP